MTFRLKSKSGSIQQRHSIKNEVSYKSLNGITYKNVTLFFVEITL
jgi:hypothetical protein